jgi:hypothetical protein
VHGIRIFDHNLLFDSLITDISGTLQGRQFTRLDAIVTHLFLDDKLLRYYGHLDQ